MDAPLLLISGYDLTCDCMNLHYAEWDAAAREASDLEERLFAAGDAFELRDAPLCDLPSEPEFEIYEDKVEAYANLKTPFPPIVLNRDGDIIDGGHRVLAARLRGDSTIPAYWPIQRSGRIG